MNPERINDIVAQLEQEIREKYDEPEITITGDNVDALGGNAVPSEQTAKIISLLCAAPNGVQAMSQDIDGLVQTSLNLGIARLEEAMIFHFSVRSSVEAEKQALIEKLRELCDFHGGNFTLTGEYPAWEYRPESPLRDTMIRVYKKMTGKDAQVVAIHAGLECGLLGQKLPGLDCVSIGPEMHDIHTSRERLGIASVERTWQFLLEVLKEI